MKNSTHINFEAFYRNNVRMVFNLCLSFLSDRGEAEDATQNAFLKFCEHNNSSSFRNSDHAKAWLIVCTQNICRDQLRRRKRLSVELSEDLDAQTSEEVLCETDAISEKVLEAIGTLADKYKAVVVLHYIEGFKTEEIATLLNIAPSTVRTRLHAARNKLKQELGVDDEDEQQY